MPMPDSYINREETERQKHCCLMAPSVFHFLLVFLLLSGAATSSPGYRGQPINDHRPPLQDFPSRHSLSDSRLGSYAAGGTKAVSGDGMLEYSSIFDYWKFLIDMIRRPFTRQQVSNQDPSEAEQGHNILFIFGDSLFDAGNNMYINNKSYPASSYPYGYTYFANATGRVCDGRIVPDFIAEYADLPLIPPSLEPGANFSYGANFASGGSAVLDSDGDATIKVINFDEQLSQFKEMVGKFNETLGSDVAAKMLKKAVYLFSIGGNDYLNYFTEMIEEGHDPTQAEQDQFVKDIIGNTTDALIEIYEVGARKIAFQNVGPMGCLPSVLASFPELNGSCAQLPLSMAKLHNEELYKALTDLADRLDGFKFSIMDYYTTLYNRMMDPSSYGFEFGLTPCYISDGDSYQGARGCAAANYTLCEYPSGYLFFDEAHTSQSANEQIAKLIWSGDSSVTGPYNVKQLFEED